MVDLIEILKKGFCGEMSDAECANAFSCKECEMQYEEGLKEKVQQWLSSFDTSSPTKCFEAVNILKMKIAQEEMHEADERLLNSDLGEMEVQE